MKENKKVPLNTIDKDASYTPPLLAEALQGQSNSVLCMIPPPQSAQLH